MANSEYDGSDAMDLGKLIGRDRGQMVAVKLGLMQNQLSWDLVSYKPDGSVIGVAAHGPIESLPIILEMLKAIGANPKPAAIPTALLNGN